MDYRQDEVERILSEYKALSKKIEEVAELSFQYDGGHMTGWDIVSGRTHAYFENCIWGCSNHYTIDFPLSYLTTDLMALIKQFKADKEKARLDKLDAEQKRREEIERENEKQERMTFEKLSKKFGANSN